MKIGSTSIASFCPMTMSLVTRRRSHAGRL